MNAAGTENGKRNPNISKWNILFEKEGKPWMSVRPQEGTEVYTCYACRELFGSKTSFLDHVNRLTIVLNFKCDMCPIVEELQFYNPCALLLHSRQHYTPLGGYISLDKIKVSCLPYGLVGFPPHRDIPMIYNVRDDDANGVNINTRFYSPAKSNKGKNVIPMVPTILLFYHYRLNGTPPASLVLKQISTNIPRCVFVSLESNTTLTTNIINTITVKKVSHQENLPSNEQEVSTVNGGNNENDSGENSNREKSNKENSSRENNKNQVEAVNIKEDVIDNDVSNEPEPSANEVNGNHVTSSISADDLQNIEGSVCPECKVHIPYAKLLSVHFTHSITKLNDAHQCNTCKYIATSPCSLSAHERLHTREPPYVCPDCGKEFESNIMLLDHIEDVCFHLAKQVRLRCSKKNCGKVFAQLPTFMSHFVVHIQTLSKCTLCDATFYAARDHLEHSETEHLRVVESELIYKCTICKNSALQKENYKDHVKWHCSDKTLRVYVYVCKYCRNFFRSSFTYANHLLRCSKKNLTTEELRRLKKCNNAIVCLHCNYVIRLMTKLEDCPRCGRWVNNNGTAPSSERKTNTKENNNTLPRTILFTRKIDPTMRNNNNTLPHTVPLFVRKISTTVENNNNTLPQMVSSSERKIGTIMENNNTLPRTIKCILCYQDLLFAQASSHECKYKYPIIALKKDDANIQEILNMKKEIQDFTPKFDMNPKKKRRKTSTSPTSAKYKRLGVHNDLELQLEEPVPFDGIYSCKICDYQNNDRLSFHVHIKEHRSVSTSYQCMECGECFVVKPSFHKHLQYYHKIVNVDDYVRENECVDESAISELKKHMRIESGEINDDVEENQCKVCLKQFEDSLELNKHFRIHGMAFLRNNK